MEIRFAEQDDLEKIVDIYNQAVRTKRATADIQELSLKDRQVWFDEHHNDKHPIYVAVGEIGVIGWCSISPYRPGRGALRKTAEISYYVDYNYHGNGIGTALITHAINDCERISINNLFALILEWNTSSRKFIEQIGFEKWGLMPGVAEFDGQECGHCIYGLRISHVDGD